LLLLCEKASQCFHVNQLDLTNGGVIISKLTDPKGDKKTNTLTKERRINLVPTEKPDFVAAEMNGRAVGGEGHEVVDHRRQEPENSVVVVVDVDRNDAVGKLFHLSKILSAGVLQDELEVAESLDQRNDLTKDSIEFRT